MNSKKKAESSLFDRVISYRAYLTEDDYDSAISMMAKHSRLWWGKRYGEREPWITSIRCMRTQVILFPENPVAGIPRSAGK